jgi:hypothetical protein
MTPLSVYSASLSLVIHTLSLSLSLSLTHTHTRTRTQVLISLFSVFFLFSGYGNLRMTLEICFKHLTVDAWYAYETKDVRMFDLHLPPPERDMSSWFNRLIFYVHTLTCFFCVYMKMLHTSRIMMTTNTLCVYIENSQFLHMVSLYTQERRKLQLQQRRAKKEQQR